MSPVNVDLSHGESRRFDGPVRSFEIQQGRVRVERPDGTMGRPTPAGHTVPGEDVARCTVHAVEPSVIRVIATSEAEAAEKRAQRSGSPPGTAA